MANRSAFEKQKHAPKVGSGSKLPLSGGSQQRPELGVKQSKSAARSAFGGRLAVAEGALGQLLVAISRLSSLRNGARTLAHRDGRWREPSIAF